MEFGEIAFKSFESKVSPKSELCDVKFKGRPKFQNIDIV